MGVVGARLLLLLLLMLLLPLLFLLLDVVGSCCSRWGLACLVKEFFREADGNWSLALDCCCYCCSRCHCMNDGLRSMPVESLEGVNVLGTKKKKYLRLVQLSVTHFFA